MTLYQRNITILFRTITTTTPNTIHIRPFHILRLRRLRARASLVPCSCPHFFSIPTRARLTALILKSPNRSVVAISVSRQLVTSASASVPFSITMATIEVNRGMPVSLHLINLIISLEVQLSARSITGFITLQGNNGKGRKYCTNMWARLRDSRPGACLIHAT